MSAVGGGHQPAGTRPGLVSLGWLPAARVGRAILIMIVTSAARYSASVPLIPRPAGPLPVELPVRLPDALVTLGLWAAAILGGGGVIAGLVAVSRGARYPAWLLIGAALVAIAGLTALPPAGPPAPVGSA